MTAPVALPAKDNKDWYAHYSWLDSVARVAKTGRTVFPETYGAVGNGTTDDQVALIAMLNDLKPGDTVYMFKRYRHSGLLPLPINDTTWFWFGELLATNRATASFQVGPAAYNTTMWNPKHTVDPWDGTGNARGGTDIQTAPFAFYDTSGIIMHNAYSANSAQCGFYLSTVHGYLFTNPTVNRSYADGFHQTHNCEDGLVISPDVWYPGDDSVAMVSYLTRGQGGPAVDPCRRIVVKNPKSRYTHARGVSIIGGEDITVFNVDVSHTRAAGLYLASESGYNTHSPLRCYFKGGKVTHVGFPIPPSGSTVDDSPLDHGPLFMLSQQATPLVDCGFYDIEVSDTGPNVFQYLRTVSNNGGAFTNCVYERNVINPGYEGRSVVVSGTQTGVTFTGNIDNRSAPMYRRLSADVSSTSTSTGNSGIGWVVGPGTYDIELEGSFTTAATGTAIKFNWGFAGSQNAFDCIWEICTSTTARVVVVTTATNSEAAGTGSASTTTLLFRVRATVVVTAAGTIFDFKFGSTVASSQVNLKRGTVGKMTKIA